MSVHKVDCNKLVDSLPVIQPYLVLRKKQSNIVRNVRKLIMHASKERRIIERKER